MSSFVSSRLAKKASLKYCEGRSAVHGQRSIRRYFDFPNRFDRLYWQLLGGKAFVRLLQETARRREHAFFIEQSKVPSFAYVAITKRERIIVFKTPTGSSTERKVVFTDLNVVNSGKADAENPRLNVIFTDRRGARNLESAIQNDRELGRTQFATFQTSDEAYSNEELACIISEQATVPLSKIPVGNTAKFLLRFVIQDDSQFNFVSSDASTPILRVPLGEKIRVRFAVNATDALTSDLTNSVFELTPLSLDDLEIQETVSIS